MSSPTKWYWITVANPTVYSEHLASLPNVWEGSNICLTQIWSYLCLEGHCRRRRIRRRRRRGGGGEEKGEQAEEGKKKATVFEDWYETPQTEKLTILLQQLINQFELNMSALLNVIEVGIVIRRGNN